MEKKTIGQFIAALRKASGMTQKQLSEKLNVSDKAVSRWERDECAPDLSLIPVIAELFGVTSDELLRGERKFEEAPVSENFVPSAKSTKQMEHILKDSKLKFGIRSLISSGIAVAGLLGAMLCNFGFNQAKIGFIVGCILFLAAAVCETIFVMLAFSSVSGDDFEGDSINLCKKAFFDKAYRTYATVFVIFAATFPLSFLDAYLGLTAESWLIYGLLFGLTALLICGIVKVVANRIALKKGVFDLPEKDREKMDKLFRHDKKYFIILVCFLLATFIMQAVFNGCVTMDTLIDGQSFDSVESFIEFMETPTVEPFRYYDSGHNEIHADSVLSYYYMYGDGSGDIEVVPSDVDPKDLFEYDGVRYFDMYGNEISEEEAMTRNFYGPDGEIIATYIEKNQTVSFYSVDWDEDGNPTINVFTFEDVRRYNAIGNSINQMFVTGYIIETAIICILWFLKRRKI